MTESTNTTEAMGFQRWIRLSVDDFPLIRPPKRHVLANITGGLSTLYEIVLNNKDNANKDKNGESEQNKQIKKIENKAVEEDDEETSPYTDEEGEFTPDETLPLLAARYKYVDVLARGQSAFIIKALDTFSKDRPVAIKVLHRVFKPIGSQEADILLELHRSDPWLHVPFARLQNQFIYGPHYCLVFEFLSPIPLFNHYSNKDIKGPSSLPYARNLCLKMLTVLGFLYKQNVIHADLKPENILLVDEEDLTSAVVIDFGNALRNTEEELSLYYSDFELQTLLYRAPEVIFGLKFSLEIDMWSLGCILAECYTGEPLFNGKTKDEILSKITELLGPFPNKFNEGECAQEFSQYIDTPLTKFERVENLRKKLDNCQDVNFIHLVESLLTFVPSKRITPFEASCHPFIANVNPVLYLKSEDSRRYPLVALDEFTYPFQPVDVDDSELDKLSSEGLHRLLTYSQTVKKGETKSSKEETRLKDKSTVETNGEIEENSSKTSKENAVKEVIIESKKVSDKATVAKKSPRNEEEKSHSGDDRPSSPCQNSKSPAPSKSVGSLSPSHSINSNEGTVLNNKNSSDVDLESPKPASKSVEITRAAVKKNPHPTDVKKTLKSMGLRCEDFTISVYSKEQAHAILRKQGVEVRNQSSPVVEGRNPNIMHRPRVRGPQSPYIRTRAMSPRFSPNMMRFNHYNPRNMHGILKPTPNPRGRPPLTFSRRGMMVPFMPHTLPKRVNVPNVTTMPRNDEDDDDCVILDPPEVPPKIPRKFTQQFQLMGTTVQVNRGAKRPNIRGAIPQNLPYAKRARVDSRGTPMLRTRDFQNQEDKTAPETSVEDTLKRLKNYNISITCRKNSTQKNTSKNSNMSGDSDQEGEGAHGGPFSDDEDMAKYLSCEIDEDRMMESGEDLNTSGGSIHEDESPIKLQSANNKKHLESTPRKVVHTLDSTVELDDDEGTPQKKKKPPLQDEKDEHTRDGQEENFKESDEETEKNDKGDVEGENEGGFGKEKLPSPEFHDPESSPVRNNSQNENFDEKEDPLSSPINEDCNPQKNVENSTKNKKCAENSQNVTKPIVKNNAISQNVANSVDKFPKSVKAPIESPKNTTVSTENATEFTENPLHDSMDDDINEELEQQLLQAGALDEDDYDGEEMEDIDLDQAI